MYLAGSAGARAGGSPSSSLLSSSPSTAHPAPSNCQVQSRQEHSSSHRLLPKCT